VGARLSELEEKHHAQFVQAGVAVVAYELDGRNNASFGDNQMMRKQYDAFKDSCAGLVNARNALEYVLGHMQAVDSTKVFAAGLGYGATHALLFAAHDARLAGVIAIHPTVDLRSHPGVESLDRSLPIRSGVRAFSSQCSPQTHVAWIRCPTYLFMETTKETLLPSNKGPDAKAFATKLKEQGTEVTYQMVESPELLPTEYNFSRGIDWLHGQLGWKK
jgi:dipeptidyl aminopeptidase/acylaminoacyl peptidase